ncbi:MAG: hypothetical protein S4CHLAM81_04910 [Chlamydiales bacterium]|nr:hypothetical protein [Chlamydiales bacterium]MCH9635279.1 hypothetical protein [Chlamydiales bacterium]
MNLKHETQLFTNTLQLAPLDAPDIGLAHIPVVVLPAEEIHRQDGLAIESVETIAAAEAADLCAPLEVERMLWKLFVTQEDVSKT